SRSFAVLFGLSLIALFLSVPRPVNFAILAVGGGVFALLIFLGLRAAAPFGRGAPLLQGPKTGGSSPASRGRPLIVSTLLGGALGGVLLLCLRLLVVVEPRLSARLAARAGQPAWMPWVLATEAAVLEELFFRLFLMSALVWLMVRWRKTGSP